MNLCLLVCERTVKWACSPACTELEAIVMDWSAKLLGLKEPFHNEGGLGGGVIQVSPLIYICRVQHDT